MAKKLTSSSGPVKTGSGIRILIHTRNPLFGKSLCLIITKELPSATCHAAAGGSLEEDMALQDVQVLMIEIDEQTSCELILGLQKKFPGIKLLLLIDRATPVGVKVRYLMEGIEGYVQSDCTPQELALAIQAVEKGQIWAERAVLSSVIRFFVASKQDPKGLSAREREVMSLLVSGAKVKEVAVRMCLSEKTVRSHLHSIYGKLGVGSRQEAIRLFSDYYYTQHR